MAMEDSQSNEERMARTIFARNIAFSATAEDFRQIPDFANAVDIKLPFDRETGRIRGFGFIEFSTAEECAKALANCANQPVEMHGREVLLAQSQAREPGQGRGRGGNRGGFRGGRGRGRGGFGQGGYGGQNNGFGGGYQNQGGYGGNQGFGGHQQQGGYGGQPQGGFGGNYGQPQQQQQFGGQFGGQQGGFGGQY